MDILNSGRLNFSYNHSINSIISESHISFLRSTFFKQFTTGHVNLHENEFVQFPKLRLQSY